MEITCVIFYCIDFVDLDIIEVRMTSESMQNWFEFVIRCVFVVIFNIGNDHWKEGRSRGAEEKSTVVYLFAAQCEPESVRNDTELCLPRQRFLQWRLKLERKIILIGRKTSNTDV